MRYILLVLFTSIATLLASQNWVTVAGTSGPQRYEDLTFIDDSLGYVISSDGPFLRTTDGGLNWGITHVFGSEEYPRAVEFLDESLGFVSSLSGRIFKTEDGGFSWVQIDLELPPSAGICGLEHQGDRIWGVGIFSYPALLIRSNDRGANWTISNLDSLADGLVEVFFRDDQTGFIGGISETEGAVILRTDDGGDSWRNVFTSAIPAEYLWKIFPVGTDTLYASVENLFSSSTTIARSYDGGENWTEAVVEPVFNDIQGIGFLDGQTGWVSPRNSPGYITEDGGDNWTRMAGIPNNVNRFYARPDGTLFAGGSAVYYYVPDTVVVSSTAGALPVHQNTTLTIFPNPVQDQLNYHLEAKRATNYRVDLFNSDGRLLAKLAAGRLNPGSYQETYNFPPDIPTGTLFLVLRSDDNMHAAKFSRQ